MGLTFFRSVKFGPLRFNFSTSGIGVSAGIRGLRVGRGPRGAYINAGRHGFRYRASLEPRRGPARHSPAPTPAAPVPSTMPAVEAENDVVGTTVYETHDVMQLTDASASDLLDMLNSQGKRKARWPWALAGGLICIGYAYGNLDTVSRPWVNYVLAASFVALVCAVAWLAWQDRLRKLTVLCYDLDETTAHAFESFIGAWQSVSTVRNLWTIPQAERYADKKYHGGAAIGVTRDSTQVRFGAPDNVRCNISVPMLRTKTATLAFYPDRLLVFRAGQVGAVLYSALQALPSNGRFNEEQAVPADTQVVGRTWHYVNKSGGPDRRFKNNREIPVCAYSELELRSDSGLSARFMASKPGAFDIVPKAVELLRVLERHSREEVTHRAAG